jgi:hypothetical protein
MNRTMVVTRAPLFTQHPDCGVSPKECAIINSIYSSRIISWQVALTALNGPINDKAKLGMVMVVVNHNPHFCSTLSACPTAAPCTIGVDRATMFYWPVFTVSGDVCGKKGQTITPTPTIPGVPNTAVFSGQTLVSPSAYLLGHGVSAHFRAGDCGNKYRSALVPIATESLSSYRKTQREDGFGWAYPFATGTPYPFDLNDLNTVPWDIYSSAVLCSPRRGRTCQLTAEPSKYTPILSLPLALKTAGFGVPGEWEGCTPGTPVGEVTYVPITGTAVTVPLQTNYGSVDNGGKLTTVTPSLVPSFDFWLIPSKTAAPKPD